MLTVSDNHIVLGGGGGGGGGGGVVGAASSTDNAIARFDGTTGKQLQNSVVTVGDTGNLSLPCGLAAGAMVVGADVNSTTLTASTRKIFRINSTSWNADALFGLLYADSVGPGNNEVHFGGSATSSVPAATHLRFSQTALQT